MKKFISLTFAALVIFCNTICCFAVNNRLVDAAGLLSVSQAQEIQTLLDRTSEKLQFDIAIVTEQSIGGNSPEAFADDYFDYNGYGLGANKDGCLLLVDMETRNFHISTHGYGITAITDNGIDYLKSKFVPSLSEGDYAAAFESFVSACDELVQSAKDGSVYDKPLPVEANWPKRILFGVIAGVVLAFIPVSIMKSKLTSAKLQTQANNYLQSGSLNITASHDIYLYSTVSKSAKQTSSGSSTHTSSSGESHGGGGGSF